MNIALLTKNFNREEKDAAVTTVLNLAKFLKEKGHNAIIVSEGGFKQYEGYKKNYPYEIINGVEVFRPYWILWFRTVKWFLDPTILINGIFFRALGVNYVQKKKKIKFDIIHGFGTAPIFVLATIIAKLFCRTAHTIYTIKSTSSSQNKFFSPMLSLLQYLHKFVDIITVPLPSMKTNLIKHNIKDKKIHILHSFIDLKKFYPKDKKKLRKKYKFTGQKIILYFGPFGRNKGPEYLLKAIPLIKKQIPKIKIILAHPSYSSEYQKKKIAKANINNCIEVIEKKVNIVDYINLADAVVLPYTTLKATEANPLCLLESMACKTPVVISNLPELNEIVQNNKDVIMSCPKNSTDLANKIIFLLKNKKMQQKIIKNAYDKRKNFDINLIGHRIMNIYLSLIKKAKIEPRYKRFK